ncbi:hypothetical protein [Bradyrhizobium sp. BR 10289]|uniref:DUF6894 family protein n=1 Tax=Bradyrhizobium sp. BR 10289 TaxID=2749993 RepID=UPI001C64BD94|nr:hypothetical protein [Bradyrhizobium sp. BR 10289]MBW7973843.1 hypothetical protein [Bradyrhizobium sp. BR 10289]
MPTYYFDMRDGVPVRDKAGVELVSDGAAIAHSKQLADQVRTNRPAGNPDLRIVVIDESGREVHREQVYPRSI